MRRKTFLIDVDGVIANFCKLYIDIVEDVLGWRGSEEDIKEWDVGDALGLTEDEKDMVHEHLFAPGAAFYMDPYPETLGYVKECLGSFDVWFVTAPLRQNPTWVFDRQRWIEKYFDKEQRKRTIFADRKERVQGDVFIDDKTSSVVSWKENNPEGIAILWSQPYNTIDQQYDVPFIRTREWNAIVCAADDMP